MCRPRVGAANPLFFLWRALWCPTAPASQTKNRRTAEESRTMTDNVNRHCNPLFDTVGNGTHKKAHIHRLILPAFLLKQMLNAKLLFQDNRNSSSANLLKTRCLLLAGNYIFTFSMKSIFIDITKNQTHILFVTDKFDLQHVY